MKSDLLNPESQPKDSAMDSFEVLFRRKWFGLFCKDEKMKERKDDL